MFLFIRKNASLVCPFFWFIFFKFSNINYVEVLLELEADFMNFDAKDIDMKVQHFKC